MMEFQALAPEKWSHVVISYRGVECSFTSGAGARRGWPARLRWDWDSFALGIAGSAERSLCSDGLGLNPESLFTCRERTKEQLAALKKHHEEEIQHHKKEIERLQKEIERHKQNIKKLKDGGD